MFQFMKQVMETNSNSKSIAKGFEGKNFYLDLENSPLICKQLTKYIQELGGVCLQLSFGYCF